MNYSITPSNDSKYIILEIDGDEMPTNMLNQFVESHTLGRRLNINHYLIDLTKSRNTGSVLDDYQFAYSDMHSTSGIDKSAIVVLVVNPDDHSHDFLETVARNSGLNMTLFRDRHIAIQHLLNRQIYEHCHSG